MDEQKKIISTEENSHWQKPEKGICKQTNINKQMILLIYMFIYCCSAKMLAAQCD